MQDSAALKGEEGAVTRRRDLGEQSVIEKRLRHVDRLRGFLRI
jgi:hypothetical protein